jgi:hypothetical protein
MTWYETEYGNVLLGCRQIYIWKGHFGSNPVGTSKILGNHIYLGSSSPSIDSSTDFATSNKPLLQSPSAVEYVCHTWAINNMNLLTSRCCKYRTSLQEIIANPNSSAYMTYNCPAGRIRTRW